jgi:hypothetical protein
MMKPNEKTAISAKDYGSNTNLKSELTMKNFTPTNEKPQLDFGRPPKVFETIHCHCCRQMREFDGYQFKLVPVCADCRTERELEITGNRFERRRSQR